MGDLIERIGIRLLVDGNGISENFKNNSLYFFDKYRRSDKDVYPINITDISPGFFYNFHYLDDSNWMMYSPVFVTNYKKISNKIIIFGVNLNFIPLEIRAFLFDDFVTNINLDQNRALVVDYEGMYNELAKYGFEYSIVEYNAAQIKMVHRIQMDLVPRFLISQHPKNKYDPKKLLEIWSAKIENRDKRHQEILKSTLDDFLDIRGEISEKYVVLKDHIQRIQTHMRKYGAM